MARDIVREGGQLTLPREVLEAAGVNPGDVAEFAVTGPHTIRIEVTPRQEADEPDSIAPDPVLGASEDSDEIPTLTLEEALERFRIEGPIDFEVEREAWYDEAAKDVFGERPGRWTR